MQSSTSFVVYYAFIVQEQILLRSEGWNHMNIVSKEDNVALVLKCSYSVLCAGAETKLSSLSLLICLATPPLTSWGSSAIVGCEACGFPVSRYYNLTALYSYLKSLFAFIYFTIVQTSLFTFHGVITVCGPLIKCTLVTFSHIRDTNVDNDLVSVSSQCVFAFITLTGLVNHLLMEPAFAVFIHVFTYDVDKSS